MASSTVAPATMAVRRSSAAVAPINGATMNSDITIRPDIAASTQGKSSHKTATAIATCPAGGRVFTPAHPLTPDSWASPLHFTEFSARSGHVAALATGGTPCTHASGRAVRLRGVRQHRQGGRSVVDIDAELMRRPWMPSVTRASCMTNIAANCRQRHPSTDGYRMHVHMQMSNCTFICKCRSAEIDHRQG
jgi:hypothetical protein